MLDQPSGWSYGKHFMSRQEMTLSGEDAILASSVLHHSATLGLAVQIVAAIKAILPDVRESGSEVQRSAFEIARLIRNAFTHQPLEPRWSIDPDCVDVTFDVPNVIHLETSGLQGKPFIWQDYGGPISLYRLSEFARVMIAQSANVE
jgi:hypothetical protein